MYANLEVFAQGCFYRDIFKRMVKLVKKLNLHDVRKEIKDALYKDL
jgi:hypothetical protein